MSVKNKSMKGQDSRLSAKARVVLDAASKLESSKINAREISKSVQSDIKLLRKFSFL